MIAWLRISPNGPGLWIASPSEFKVYSVRRRALRIFGWAIKILPRVKGLDPAALERLRKDWEKRYTGLGLTRNPVAPGSQAPLCGKWFGFRWKGRTP